MSIIQLNALSVTFRVGALPIRAVNKFDLSIDKGEMVAIVGRSGSGKSTLAHIIGLLLTPTDGHYWLQGVDVSRLPAGERARIRNQKIGFVFQKYHLLPRMTVIQNVILPLIYNRDQPLSRRQAITRAEHCLDTVGLRDRADQRPTTLSGGEQQRVTIARAMVNDPAIILADEPTGALDTTNGNKVADMLQDLSRRDGRTVLIVTHDPNIATRFPRQISLSDGRLLKDEAEGLAELGDGRSTVETAGL